MTSSKIGIVVLGAAVYGTALVCPAQALELGNIEVHSRLGQAFSADVPLQVASPSDLDGLTAGSASATEYQQAGLPSDAVASTLQYKLQTHGGQAEVLISGQQPVSSPLVNLLLKVNWNGGTLLREYTVLLNPPDYGNAAAITERSVPGTVHHTPAAAQDVETVGDALPDLPPPVRVPVGARPAASATVLALRSRAPSHPAHATVGPVQPHETLWHVASQVRPDTDVTMDQVMLALYRANPKAFGSAGWPSLLTGSVLFVPSRTTMAQTPPDEARAEIEKLKRTAVQAAPATVTASMQDVATKDIQTIPVPSRESPHPQQASTQTNPQANPQANPAAAEKSPAVSSSANPAPAVPVAGAGSDVSDTAHAPATSVPLVTDTQLSSPVPVHAETVPHPGTPVTTPAPPASQPHETVPSTTGTTTGTPTGTTTGLPAHPAHKPIPVTPGHRITLRHPSARSGISGYFAGMGGKALGIVFLLLLAACGWWKWGRGQSRQSVGATSESAEPVGEKQEKRQSFSLRGLLSRSRTRELATPVSVEASPVPVSPAREKLMSAFGRDPGTNRVEPAMPPPASPARTRARQEVEASHVVAPGAGVRSPAPQTEVPPAGRGSVREPAREVGVPSAAEASADTGWMLPDAGIDPLDAVPAADDSGHSTTGGDDRENYSALDFAPNPDLAIHPAPEDSPAVATTPVDDQIELAKVYLQLEERAAARDLLNAVVEQGTPDQVQAARELLSTLDV